MEDHAKPVRAPFLHSAQGKYVFTYVVVIAAILVLAFGIYMLFRKPKTAESKLRATAAVK